jgi:hypothetical protein
MKPLDDKQMVGQKEILNIDLQFVNMDKILLMNIEFVTSEI